jgi:hypothetical protein
MKKIQARMIIEILGRPPEHIVSSLNMLLDRLAKESEVKILERKVMDPILVKDSKDLYTTFAEVVLEIDSLEKYFVILFAYLPANFEIISPEELVLSNQLLSAVTSKLVQRLHEYDSLAKNVIGERDIILKKLQEVAPHLFKHEQPQEQSKQAQKTQKKKPKKQRKEKTKRKK